MSGVLITISIVLMLALALLLDHRARTKHGGRAGSGRRVRDLRYDGTTTMQSEQAQFEMTRR